MKQIAKLKNNEKGMISMIVAIFFMIVLSITVLAFSQTSRREQRQALDSQLSSQAFYAAESGVNETVGYIRQHFSDVGLPEEKTICESTGMPADFPSGNIGESGNTSYPCVLFDRAPRSIQLDGLNTDQGRFVALDTKAIASNKLTTVTLKWRKSGSSNHTYAGCPGDDFSGINTLPEQSGAPGPGAKYPANCDAGMMRVTMFPIVAGSTDRNGLSENTFTAFFKPVNKAGAPGSIAFVPRGSSGSDANATSQGQIFPAYCGTDSVCTASINVSSQTSRGGISSLYAHFRSIYYSNDLNITGAMTDGTEARFNRAQIMVDVTGRASDVLRRIQVRVPLFQQYPQPTGFGIDSAGGVCKRLEVYPGYGIDDGCLSGTNYFN